MNFDEEHSGQANLTPDHSCHVPNTDSQEKSTHEQSCCDHSTNEQTPSGQPHLATRAKNTPYICPMHPEVHELHDDASCPICNMRLIETRRVAAWTCPTHSVIFERGEGVCPIDGEKLVRMNLGLAWTCPEHSEIDALNPGLCPIDNTTSLVQRLSPLPHEDHTPKHGGIFFMAPDNWHHIEGVYLGAVRIAVYVYDNYSQPMSAKAVHGRIVLEEK